jgi:hypothetical protein
MVFDRRPDGGLTSIPRIPLPACYRPRRSTPSETELLRPLAPALLNGVRRQVCGASRRQPQRDRRLRRYSGWRERKPETPSATLCGDCICKR